MFSSRCVGILCAVFAFHFSTSLGDLYEGDKCTMKNGHKGTCRYLTKCQSALAAISKGKFPDSQCGFDGSQVIVCCEEVAVAQKQPSTTTEKTTTTTTPKPPPKTKTTTSASPTLIQNRIEGAISKQKCKDYAKFAYNREESPVLSLIPQYSNITECAFERIPLIVGGTLAERQEFPHMAQIGYQTADSIEWACGGTLISENFVLTAGHCLRDRELGPAKFVRIGITNVTDLNHAQQLEVVEIIKHPKYVSTKYHDIGLLKLKTDAELNTYARPACLYLEKEIPYANAIASGWGRIEYSGSDSKELLKVVLEFFSQQKCNTTYKRDINQPDSPLEYGILDNLMLCAGSSTKLRDTCQGDSGGPLQIYHDGGNLKCMYDIVGVTSFGKSCGLAKNVPGVYTRVSAYIKWIEDTIWPYEYVYEEA